MQSELWSIELDLYLYKMHIVQNGHVPFKFIHMCALKQVERMNYPKSILCVVWNQWGF